MNLNDAIAERDPVAGARSSEAVRRKKARGRTPGSLPPHRSPPRSTTSPAMPQPLPRQGGSRRARLRERHRAHAPSAPRLGTSAEVRAETRRLVAAGMATVVEESTVCCHAEQDKVWVRDPAGIRWEVYTITDDAPNRGRVAALATAEMPAPTGAKTSPECCVR